jgi:hypothetical protein
MLQGLVWPEAQPLHDAGPEPLDEHVGAGDEVEDEVASLVSTQIHDNAFASTSRDITERITHGQSRTGRLDANAGRTEISEHHRGERGRADAGRQPSTTRGSRSSSPGPGRACVHDGAEAQQDPKSPDR